MELHLGLALSTNPAPASHYHMKRSFSQILLEEHAADTEEATLPPTLSLLPLTPAHITKCDDDDDDDGEALVGWPPVNYWRKKLRYEEDNDHIHTRLNTVYVKVEMEGVGIARKVDLTLHHSFQTLKQTLMRMFGKYQEQYLNSYELAYQDKEGDWLLAEDVSWRSFIQCALRLKLLKTRR